MTLSFGSTTGRIRGYKSGSSITTTPPVVPSAPVLGNITNQSGTVKRVAIVGFPSTANYLIAEVSYNGGEIWNSVSVNILPGSTYFDCDVGSNSAWSFRARAVNAGGTSVNSNVVSGAIITPPSAPATFGFESWTVNTSPDGLSAGGVTIGGKGSAYASVSNTRAKTGTQSTKLTYLANASYPNEGAEFGFDLGAEYREVTIDFDWYIPSNYVHRNLSPTNNKMFRLWPGTDGASAGYNSNEKIGASMWRVADNQSNIQVDWNFNGEGLGPKGSAYSNWVTSADFGTWVTVKIYCKAPTSSNSADGIIRIYKNGVQVVNETNVNSWTSGQSHAYRYGYLMGWANSGYAAQTDFFIDNVVFTVASPVAQTLYAEDFLSTSVPSNWASYDSAATIQIISDPAQVYGGSGNSLKANYPQPGGGSIYVIGNYDVSNFTSIGPANHVYIDFYAKMPNSKQGLKFCKIFGKSAGGTNYANTTFGLDYTGAERGGMYYVGFGDGSGVGNDTQNGIWLAGINDPDAAYHGAGRSVGLPGNQILTPQNRNWTATDWGAGWHRWQLYLKFNSGTTAGNEVNDGELKILIDGLPFVDAKGLFNRHYSNGPISHIHFFEWSQTGTSPFDIWIDSIRISQNGWTR